MQILRLLNKKFIIIFFYIFFIPATAISNEPVDIWNIDKNNNNSKNNSTNSLSQEDEEISIYTDIKNEPAISITQEKEIKMHLVTKSS